MKKFRNFWFRFIENFREAFIFGTVAAVIAFYIFEVIDIVTFSTQDMTALEILLGIHVFSIIFCTLLKFRNVKIGKSPQPFHKYDADIIGSNFIGFSKKCRIFQQSIEFIFNKQINYALNGFKQIEEELDGSMTESEKGVLCFYIARCYDIMQYFPNAARYYADSGKYGFSDKYLKFFMAKCSGNLGDTQEALNLYSEILGDETNPLKLYINVEIGRMYLKLDDGENALKYFNKSIENHENYSNALAGAAIANLLLHNFEEAVKLRRMALLNGLTGAEGFNVYFREIMINAKNEENGNSRQGG